MTLSDKRINYVDGKGKKSVQYHGKDVKEFIEDVLIWAEKWGYKGVSPDCIKELKELAGEKLI